MSAIKEYAVARRIGMLLVMCFCFSQYSSGASFSCARAGTSVEKLICKDPELSELDEEMAPAYGAELAISPDPAYFRNEHKAWLKKRDGCHDNSCLVQHYRERILTLTSGAATLRSPSLNQKAICKKMRTLFLSNAFRQYAVEFTEPEDGETEYPIFFRNDQEKASLHAYCGNGAGSLCEVELHSGKKPAFTFTLPTTMRVLDIAGSIYIVNGIYINIDKKVTAKDYSVHELHPQSLRLVCNKF